MSRKSKRNAPEIVLNVLSNKPEARDFDVLQMLYSGAFANQLALMHAKHEPTGEIHTLLVGMEYSEDLKTSSAYPLARLLSVEQIAEYKAPDGKGGWE